MAGLACSPTKFFTPPPSAFTSQQPPSCRILVFPPKLYRIGPMRHTHKNTHSLNKAKRRCNKLPAGHVFKRADCNLQMNKVTVGSEVQEGGSSYFDSPSVLNKMASVLFVFQGETSEHLLCSLEQHAGVELQAAPVHENA